MKEMIQIPITIRKDTYEKIEKIVKYKNLKNQILVTKDKTINYDVGDFINGCVVYYLSYIEAVANISGIYDLGKPYKLKNRFKEILKQRKMSQKELAERTGIDNGNISIILSNRSQPSLDYFLRIWVALDFPPIETILYREKD